jgi:amidase
MIDSELYNLPVRALAAALRRGELSSETVTRAFLERIEAVNPKLSAVVQVRADAALAEARAADLVPTDRRSVLHGVPITIKDSLDTAGIITTAGTKGRAEFMPIQDATVVRRVREAGAIIMGKTNTPELTLNYETSNSVYGRTNNPFDLDRTSGGSSGGAAAIIAAGGSPLDIGSDTGASIRLPAHFCGIVGLKATAGRVPRTGHIIDYQGGSQFLTHIGPLARQVDDLTLLLGVIAGPDGVDPHVMPVPLGDPAKIQVTGMRVGHFTGLPPLNPTAETAAAVQSAVAALLDAGCSAREIEIPDSDAIFEMYMAVLFGDGGAAVKRALDRWGTAQSALRTRVEGMSTLSSGELTARYEQVDRWRSRMLALFADIDVIICPVNVGPAPLHNMFERASASYTQAFNLTGWPSTVVRAGTSVEGLPVGVQVVAPSWREDVSLAVAAKIEKALGPFPGPSAPTDRAL